jgi:hypothetical protein
MNAPATVRPENAANTPGGDFDNAVDQRKRNFQT